MKKILLVLVCILFTKTMIGQVIWSSDFSTPSDWSITNNSATGSLNWVITSTMPTSANLKNWLASANNAFNSTSKGNFALLDGSTAGAGTRTAYLTMTKPVSTVGKSNIMVKYNQLYARYQDFTSVEVSTDNVSWTAYTYNYKYKANQSTSNPENVNIDISELVGNQSNVWFRFKFVGTQNDYDYGWFVDDFSIEEIPQNDLRVLSGYITGQTQAIQSCLGTTEIGVYVINKGLKSVTSGTSVSYKVNSNSIVTESASWLDYKTKQAKATLAYGDTALYVFSTKVDLSAELAYAIKAFVTLPSDQSVSNDTVTLGIANLVAKTVDNVSSYNENFEAGKMNGFTVEDVDKRGYKFGVANTGNTAVTTTTVSTAAACLRISEPTGKVDDWAYSPCLNLKPGHLYTLSYYTRLSANVAATSTAAAVNFGGNIEAKLGKSAVSSAMTQLLSASKTLTPDGKYQQLTTTFSVSEPDVYHIGFHVTNTDTSKYTAVRIDDISLTARNLSNEKDILACKSDDPNVYVNVYSDQIKVTLSEGYTNKQLGFTFQSSPNSKVKFNNNDVSGTFYFQYQNSSQQYELLVTAEDGTTKQYTLFTVEYLPSISSINCDSIQVQIIDSSSYRATRNAYLKASGNSISTTYVTAPSNSDTLLVGREISGIINAAIRYTGGNGQPFVERTVLSSGVTGLKATLKAGNLANGDGRLFYQITGKPENAGVANFAIDFGGQSCNFSITVIENTAKSSACDLLSFKFISPAVIGKISGSSIYLTVPAGTNVSNLVASFTVSSYASVTVGSNVQVSGQTPNNFSDTVRYTVTAEDGTIKNYSVIVNLQQIVKSSACEMTSFGFTNPSVVGTISGTNIALTVPAGTNVTNLIANFTISPKATVKVGSINQVSGQTANNFTSSVAYVVTAEDGVTVKLYTISVTVQSVVKSSACDLYRFFIAGPNRTAIIDGTNITLNIPQGTDLTSLVAYFNSSAGSIVKVNGVDQISGTTKNNFSSSLNYIVIAEDGVTAKKYTVTIKSTDVLWTSDFTNSSDWEINTKNYTGAINWSITSIVPDSRDLKEWLDLMGRTFKSKSGGNFAVVNSSVSLGTYNASFTTKNPLSTVGKKSVLLTYNQLYKRGTDTAKVEVSFDSINWTSYFNNNRFRNLQQSPNAELVELDITSIASNKSKVWVRFTQIGSSSGTNFAWFVDDVSIESELSKDTTQLVKSSACDITSFSITNPSVPGAISGSNIMLTVPSGTDVTKLIASFTSSPLSNVKIGQVLQTSGQTSNDFTSLLTYVVTAEDGSTKSYFVSVTVAPSVKSSACDLLSFGVLTPLKSGIINGKDVFVTLPNGTNLSSLVATFTVSTGASVTVNADPQVSGTTVNNFTTSVDYIVTAEDAKTIKTYKVLITTLPSTNLVLWSSDFSKPSDWTITNNSATGSLNWVITSTMPTSANLKSWLASVNNSFNSTSKGNFALVDGSTAGAGERTAIMTMSTPVSTSGKSNVMVKFSQLYARWQDVASVELSTDNSTWTPFTYNNKYKANQSTTNPENVSIDISSVAANKSQVWVRLKFVGTSNDYDFAWFVDDFSIEELPNNDLSILSGYITGQTQFVQSCLGATDIGIYVVNKGLKSITSGTPVSYKVNSNSIVTESASWLDYKTKQAKASVAYGDTALYVFSTKVDLSAELAYSIKAFVTLPSDQAVSNDTVTLGISNLVSKTVDNVTSYTENFEAGKMNGFTSEDLDKRGYKFGVANTGNTAVTTTTVSTAAACIRISEPKGASEDWAYSPCLNLKPGYLYTLSYYTRLSANVAATSTSAAVNFGGNIETKLGKSAVSSAMTQLLSASKTLTPDGKYQQLTTTFSVTEPTVYYLGFHVTNTDTSKSSAVRIDDISLTAKSTQSEITSYNFTNPAVSGVISGTDISITVPAGTDVAKLVANFVVSKGATAVVVNTPQVSGTTVNNFTTPLTYVVTAEDGVSKTTYKVTVTITQSSKSSAKDLLSFSFSSPAVSGVITGSDVAVTVPSGTDVSKLVAMFEISPKATIKVGSTIQISGQTANDFTNQVMYVVTAEDGSNKIYYVQVAFTSASASISSLRCDTVEVQNLNANNLQLPSGSYNPSRNGYTAASKGLDYLMMAYDTLYVADSIRGINLLVSYYGGNGGAYAYQSISSIEKNGVNLLLQPGTLAIGKGKLTFKIYGETRNVRNASFNLNIGGKTCLVKFNIKDTSKYIIKSSAKDILSFGFTNPFVVGTITNSDIALTVPAGTNVTNLIANFSVSPKATVKVGSINQVSGQTANNFMNSVSYFVTAEDGTTKIYYVQVAFTSASASISSLRCDTVEVQNLNANNLQLPSGSYNPSRNGYTAASKGLDYLMMAYDTLYVADSIRGINLLVSYYGGNGGAYAYQSVSSNEKNGVKLLLQPGTLAVGKGKLTFKIYGETRNVRNASFNLNIGGKTCLVKFNIKDTSKYTVIQSSAKDITAFSFVNPTVTGVISGTTISLTVPAGTNVTNLIANFSVSPKAIVKVGATTQVNGQTANNFTTPVSYIVTAEDGTTKNYVVVVTVSSVPKSSANDFISFSLSNPSVIGQVFSSGPQVRLLAPAGTDLTKAILNFQVSPGATVYVKNVKQVSGVSTINVSSAYYDVVAEDGSTKTYLVQVSFEPAILSGQKTLCVNANSQLTANVSGSKTRLPWVISDTSIAKITVNGLVTAIKQGKCFVSFYDVNGYKTNDTITVLPTSITSAGSISGKSDMCMGEVVALSETNQGGFWSSSDTTIATIDGKSGQLTAKSDGQSEITYTIPGSSKCDFALTKLNIVVHAPLDVLPIEGVTTFCKNSSTNLSSQTNLGTWESNNTSVASVDANGKVSGLAAGTSKITYTVSQNGCTSATTTNVEIIDLPLIPAITGNTDLCTGSITQMSNTYQGGIWKVSNTSVVKIDSNGFITPLIKGVSEIIYRVTENGCTSYRTIVVNVKNASTSTETKTACTSYTWNNQTYTQSGVYTYTTNNKVGCDSVVTLNLTIDSVLTQTEKQTACGEYTWHGKTYTQSGTYVDSLKSITGCDSIVTLYLTISPKVAVTETKVSCGAYSWHGKTYTQSGSFVDTMKTQAGCDSIITLNLTIKSVSTSTLSVTACGSYVWNKQTYLKSGIYTHATKTLEGCDSIAILNLTMGNVVYVTETKTACASFTWHGKTYTQSGTHVDSLKTPTGCDSIVTLNLKLQQAVQVKESKITCGAYTWHGKTYPKTGTYVDSLKTQGGCDSLVTLDLTIAPVLYGTETKVTCNDFTWHGKTYSKSGTYVDTLKTTAGCDSVVTLKLQITPAVSSTETKVTCSAYTWHGKTYAQSGTYVDTMNTQAGCDSIVTLNLTIKSVSTSTENIAACGSYVWNKQTYAKSGIYTYPTKTLEGCDSIAILNLTIHTGVSSTLTKTACGSFTWNGKTLNQSGTYVDSLKTIIGCDSVVTLKLTINQGVTATESKTACGVFVWHSKTYTQSGTYVDTLQTSLGCDSIVTMNLTVNPIPAIASILGDTSITVGLTSPLSVATTSGTWSSLDASIAEVTAQGVVTGVKVGTTLIRYEVTANGCMNAKTIHVVVAEKTDTTTTGLQTMNASGMEVYPNPFVDKVQIALDQVGDYQIQVYDLSGKRLTDTRYENTKTITLNLEHIASGEYVLKVIHDQFVQTRKLKK